MAGKIKITLEQKEYLRNYAPLAKLNNLNIYATELWNLKQLSREDLTWLALELLRKTIEE